MGSLSALSLLFLLVVPVVGGQHRSDAGGAPTLRHPPCKIMLANGSPIEVIVRQNAGGTELRTETIKENSIGKQSTTWECGPAFTYSFVYGTEVTRQGNFPPGGISGSLNFFVSNTDAGRLDVGYNFEEFPTPSDADNTNDNSAFIIFINLLHSGTNSETVKRGPEMLLPPFKKGGGEKLVPGKGDDQYVKQDATKLGIKLVEGASTSDKDLKWEREVGESEIAVAYVMGTPDKMFLKWHMVRKSDILNKALHELPFFQGAVPWIIFIGVTVSGPILYFVIVQIRSRNSSPMKDDPLGQLVLAEDEDSD